MKHVKLFEEFVTEKKPKGAPDFHHSDAPDAEGRFRDLSIKDLAAWLIKTRKKDVKKISGSLTQQYVFNRNDDPDYAEKMQKTRKEVYKQLGREDLIDKMDESVILEFNTYTGDEVAQYIEDITPEESDIPDYFIDKYIKPNDGWQLKQIKLKDLLKDKDFKDYYNSGEERYDEYEVDPNDLYNDLVVYKGQLLDGYSRAAKMLRDGEKTAGAYVLDESVKFDTKSTGREDWDKDLKKHAGEFTQFEVNMSPDEFLKRVQADRFKQDSAKIKKYASQFKRGAKDVPTPTMWFMNKFQYEKGLAPSFHDGSHRVLALKEIGVEEIPVKIIY